MHRNHLIPRHHPVLAQIAQNDRKNCIELQLNHNQRATRRSEFVHATVEDDLIGPGHIRSRSRSRTRDATRRNGVTAGHRSSSSAATGSTSAAVAAVTAAAAAVRSGLEINVPQRGRYIVVEDVRSKNNKKRTSTPEFVLVNKENGRAIPLHSLYQNPNRAQPSTPTDPPVDYDCVVPRSYRDHNESDPTVNQFNQHQRHILEGKFRKARSTSDLSDEGDKKHRHSLTNSSAASISSKNSPSLRKPLVLYLSFQREVVCHLFFLSVFYYIIFFFALVLFYDCCLELVGVF